MRAKYSGRLSGNANPYFVRSFKIFEGDSQRRLGTGFELVDKACIHSGWLPRISLMVVKLLG